MPARRKAAILRSEVSAPLLEVTADAVIEELEAWLGDRLPQRRQWITRLADHAHGVMAANARFRRRVNAAPDVEPLVVYLRHWLAVGLKQEHSTLFTRLPYRYAVGARPPRTRRVLNKA